MAKKRTPKKKPPSTLDEVDMQFEVKYHSKPLSLQKRANIKLKQFYWKYRELNYTNNSAEKAAKVDLKIWLLDLQSKNKRNIPGADLILPAEPNLVAPKSDIVIVGSNSKL